MNIKKPDNTKQIHLAIFASGRGSNARKIIDHFKNTASVKIILIVSNDPSSGVLDIAQKENIASLIIERKIFNETGYVQQLKDCKVDLIVLAGFLWKVPPVLIRNFHCKIINIHPALLPKFGGKGMYGDFVHEAVLQAKEKESGITIHFVDELYDHGKIIFQAKCNVDENDTPHTLAHKIHVLEHHYYSLIIEDLVTSPA